MIFIISTGRAGSTAIYNYINKMCDLKLPKNKEPHYWINLEKYKNKTGPILDCYVSNLDEYKKLYDKSKIVIDASVGYFFYIDEFINRIKKASIEPKIIFLYREPIGRAYSLFQNFKNLNITKTLKIEEEIVIKWEPGSWWARDYDNVFYYDVYKKLKYNFKDILIMNFDEFKENTNNSVHKIIKFIGFDIVKKITYEPLNASSDILLKNFFLSFVNNFLKFFPNFFKKMLRFSLKELFIFSIKNFTKIHMTKTFWLNI